MEKASSKLRHPFVLLLILIAAVTTASSQQAPDLDALAAKGEAIANADPLSSELRNQVSEGPSRRGFYIGMAVAEGQTLPGPGKDRLGNSLIPAEREGFKTAVSFSVDRNRNADLAKKGAVIATMDPTVAEARTVVKDVLYWLGFDIATGIFGDPALGAQGKTAKGPGSLGIRDLLSDRAKSGFNASMEFHLRKYQRTSGGPGGYDTSAPVTRIESTTGRPPVPVPAGPGGYDPSSPVTRVENQAGGGAAEVLLALRPFIDDVQVRPDTRDVIISFTSTQKTPPLIEIGRVAPAPDQQGILAFPADSGAFSRFVPGQNGTYSLNLGTLGEQLDIGSRYYYIINVFNDNKNNTKRPREQVTGKFFTLPQTIKVVFTEIHIVSNLLAIHHEDYVFQFDVHAPGAKELGPREPWYSSKVTGRRVLGAAHKPLKLARGANAIEGFEIVLEYAPDALGLGVAGEVPNLQYVSQGSVREDILYKNTASGSFDLSAYPGDSVSIPFTLTSPPPTRLNDGRVNRGLLQFRITGRIEVTRPRP